MVKSDRAEGLKIEMLPAGTRPVAMNDRVLGLDVLRVFAVALVLGRHLPAPPAHMPLPVRWVFDTWRRGGWAGVDLFFVLSGFLVSGLLFSEYQKRRGISILRFYARRAWKIYPPFYFLIFVTVLWELSKGYRPWDIHLVSELLFLQSYIYPIWVHTWSLAVEEHFYLMLPLLLGGLLWLRRGSADPFRPILLVAAFVCLALLLLRIYHAWSYPKFSVWSHLFPTHLRLDSLLFGVAISYAFRFHLDWFQGLSRAHRMWMMIGGCAAFVPAFVFTLEKSPFLYTAALSLFYLGGGALLIGVLLGETTKNRATAVVGMIGAYSYSIYLWHVPVLKHLPLLFERVFHFPMSFAMLVPAGILVSLVGGVIMARLIEVPALILRDRWFPARNQSV
jgi:peptidoglycan/LPS O-acetylase OafA/YrhL